MAALWGMMKLAEEDLKLQPGFRYTATALRNTPIAAIAVAALYLLAVDRPERFVIAGLICGLALVVSALSRYVLPGVRTRFQLDLVSAAYSLLVISVMWCGVYFAPSEDPCATACAFIVASAVLHSTKVGLLLTTVIASGGWILFRYLGDGVVDEDQVLELFCLAPVIALITHLAVRGTHDALEEARKEQQDSLQKLEETVEQLNLETQRRRESETRLLHARKTESLGLLAAGVAHDFNNVLLAISAFAENIRATSDRPQERENAGQIVKAVGQASGICQQMLTYAGKGSDQHSSVDLTTLARETLPLLKASTSAGTILRLSIKTSKAAVRGNPTQLQQVMINLVKNASEATEGSGEVKVTVSKTEFEKDLSNVPEGAFGAPLMAGVYFELKVRDDGCGIASETIQQMFDPYFTTKESGHGFGLSTVLGIVRSHKATLIIDTAPSEGTAIRVLFPAYGAPFADSNSFRIPQSASLQTSRRHLLLIDDEEMVRTPMAEMLRLLGWDVTEASGAAEAMVKLEERDDFAAILIDYVMPETNGLETLSQLRDRGVTAPAILCSGFISEPEQDKVLDAFDGFLPKPFRRDQLENKLNSVLGAAHRKPTTGT